MRRCGIVSVRSMRRGDDDSGGTGAEEKDGGSAAATSWGVGMRVSQAAEIQIEMDRKEEGTEAHRLRPTAAVEATGAGGGSKATAAAIWESRERERESSGRKPTGGEDCGVIFGCFFRKVLAFC